MTALMDVLQGAIDIDTNIFLFINGMHNTFFDYFMSAYSGKWRSEEHTSELQSH